METIGHKCCLESSKLAQISTLVIFFMYTIIYCIYNVSKYHLDSII